MKDTIFIVVSEWESQDGSFDSNVIGVFYDFRQAAECLKKERDTILEESYNTTFEKYENDVNVMVKCDDYNFFVTEKFGNRWDSITIHEKEIEQRDFIAIQFEYDGEVVNERIYLDQIDRTHYDDHWDWWFGTSEGSKHPKLNFELFGDKDDDGNIIYDAFEINVYEDDEAWSPMARITDYQLTQSWLGKKDGFIKYFDYAKG